MMLIYKIQTLSYEPILYEKVEVIGIEEVDVRNWVIYFSMKFDRKRFVGTFEEKLNTFSGIS